MRRAVLLVAALWLAGACGGDATETTPSTSPPQTVSPTMSTTEPSTSQSASTSTTAAPIETETTTPATPTTVPADGDCSLDAIEAGLPYPGISDPSMIVRFECAEGTATILAKPPTDAPSFVVVLVWSDGDWVFDRECHNDVLGVAECLGDTDPALVDALALVGETFPRNRSEVDPSAWPRECATPALRRGDSGLCVARLQTLLALTGASIEVDGRFGDGTEARLVAFQAEAGLETDGLAGPMTWVALVDAAGA